MIEPGTWTHRSPSARRAGDDARIHDLERKVAGITNMIGAFAARPPASRHTAPEMIGLAAVAFPSPQLQGMTQDDMERQQTDADRARFVRDHIRQRHLRGNLFPDDLFSDPVWDMLLDLYAARLEGVPVSVSSLCIAAAVPATTALRWIKGLTARGLFLRTRDESDGRRVYIHLSDETAQKLESYFDMLQS